MERYTIEVRKEVTPFLQEAAEAKGVTVEEEIIGLVQRTYAKRADDDWVHELIAMTRPGFIFEIPRMPWDRQTPFEFDDFS